MGLVRSDLRGGIRLGAEEGGWWIGRGRRGEGDGTD
jgi:hypothetical protein